MALQDTQDIPRTAQSILLRLRTKIAFMSIWVMYPVTIPR